MWLDLCCDSESLKDILSDYYDYYCNYYENMIDTFQIICIGS